MTTNHKTTSAENWEKKIQEYKKFLIQIQKLSKTESQRLIQNKMQKLIQLMQEYKIPDEPTAKRQIQSNSEIQIQKNAVRDYIQGYFNTSTNEDINEIIEELGNLEIDENGLNGYQRFLKYKPFKYITKRGIDISPDIIPDNTTTEAQKLEQIIQILTTNGTRPEEIQNTITNLKDMDNGYQRFLTFLKAGIQYKIQNGIEYIKEKDKQKKKDDENQTKLW